MLFSREIPRIQIYNKIIIRKRKIEIHYIPYLLKKGKKRKKNKSSISFLASRKHCRRSPFRREDNFVSVEGWPSERARDAREGVCTAWIGESVILRVVAGLSISIPEGRRRRSSRAPSVRPSVNGKAARRACRRIVARGIDERQDRSIKSELAIELIYCALIPCDQTALGKMRNASG